MQQALDDLIALLDLEPIEVNIFRGTSPDVDAQRVFGGQVAGQALVAAARTVEPDRRVHSLHAYFLRPGDPTVPILYEVDRIRDGRSFTTRRVVAIQHGRAIFNLQTSFHVPEDGLRPRGGHAHRRARAPLAARLQGSGGHPGPRSWATGTNGPGPSTAGTWTGSRSIAAGRCRRANGCGCGPTARLPDDPVLHACIVTYASDMTLLDTTLLPHAVGAIEHNLVIGQPRPRHVVPPTVSGRRVAALRPGQPVGVGGPGHRPGLDLHPRRTPGRDRGAGGADPPQGLIREPSGPARCGRDPPPTA